MRRIGLKAFSYRFVVSGEVDRNPILSTGIVASGLDSVDDLYVVVFCYGWKEQAGVLLKILINGLN